MKTTVDQKILKELKAKGKVSTVRLAHRSGSFAVHSAIDRLRRLGYKIECTTTQDPNRRAWYSLQKPTKKAKDRSR